jgi:hypothetical protein
LGEKVIKMEKMLLIFGILAAVLLMAGCAAQTPVASSTPQPSQTSHTPAASTTPTASTTPITSATTAPAPSATATEVPSPVVVGNDSGRVLFTIADAAANMSAISSIVVTIDNISVHRSGGSWVDVSTAPKSYDLLQLNAKGTKALLAEMGLEQGIYYEIRLGISNVVVTDSAGSHDAKLPSGVLKIVGRLAVNVNQTSTVSFDFIANESLHATGNGEYILAPIVKLQTAHGSEADVTSEGVSIKGGVVDTNTEVGMDENGLVGPGIKILPSAKLSIVNGKIKKK